MWQQLHDGDDVVVTLNGKPVALLLPADERFLERELEILRRVRAELALEDLHRMSLGAGNDMLTDEEIEEDIQTVRKGKRRG
ncbi:Antitoxin [Kyrpidia spormannii]|uniref:Antitoxin n=1 Tax=Kyrpidia spormannii TaxID=2055160 RepID=A0ACA8ZE17_9BACL|nr:Antitoxin [Kyrpidia spormannii]